MRTTHASPQKIAIAEKIIDFLQSKEGVEYATALLHQGDFDSLIHQALESVRVYGTPARHKVLLDFAKNLLSHQELTKHRDLAIYLRYHELSWKVRTGQEIDWSVVLGEWEDAREHWTYSGILDHALTLNETDEAIMTRCREHLRTQNSPVRSSSDIILAETIAKVSIKQNRTERFRECTDLLTNWIVPALPEFPIEHAVETYVLLLVLDPEKQSEYFSRHTYWTVIMLERKRIEKMRDLLHDGHYWRVFFEYYRALLLYGLPLQEESVDFSEELKKGSKEALAWFFAQDAERQKNLTSMVGVSEGRSAVRLDFIRLGEIAFAAPEEGNPRLEKLKNDLNETCRQRIGEYFAIVSQTATVPGILRGILEEHRSELESWLKVGGRPIDEELGG
jgi:hypothetical protein